MYRNVNLKRGHLKIGCSVVNVKKMKKEKSPSPEHYKIIEKKIMNMNFDKVKPLKFKF